MKRYRQEGEGYVLDPVEATQDSGAASSSDREDNMASLKRCREDDVADLSATAIHTEESARPSKSMPPDTRKDEGASASAPREPGSTAYSSASASVLLGREPEPLPHPHLQRILDAHKTLPRLFIVDLDYTLWPGYVIYKGTPVSPHPIDRDTVVFRPPASRQPANGEATLHFGLFREAREVLRAMQTVGAKLAVASKSPDLAQASTVLQYLGLHTHFECMQVFRDATKRSHLSTILQSVKVKAHEALFFDDEAANIKEARKMGLSAFQVNRACGLDWKAFEGGLKAYKADSSGRRSLAGFFKKAEP